MKKLLLILAVASVFTACGNNANDTTATDTTNAAADTTTIPGIAVTPAGGDTALKVVDTTATKPADTLKK